MQHKGIAKRVLSFVLSAGIVASGAVGALAASVTNSTYDANFTGSEALVSTLKSSDNLVYGNTYRRTTDLDSLNAGEYAVTGTAVDEDGNVVFNSVTDDLSANHITDGNLVYDSATVKDIRAWKGSSTASSDYFAPNGSLTFMKADGTFRTDVYYDVTFRLIGKSRLSELIYVHSNGTPTQYAKYYDVYASDSADTLYNPENLKYSCTNDVKTDDSGSVQNIHFDDNTEASFVGIRIKQGVGDDWGFGANYAFVRIYEIGIIGKCIEAAVTYPTPTMSSTEKIADKTADGKGITENLLFNKQPSVIAVREGQSGITINYANLGKINDGYYNNTATDSCDVGGLPFIKSYDETTGTYTYYNGYDPDTMTYNEDPDTYLTLTYKLNKTFDLTDFWFYSESSCMDGGAHNLRTGVYEMYAANTAAELYNAENKILTYVNTNNSYCQKFRFDGTHSGKYIGIKIIEGVTKLNTGNWKYSYCRLPEIALFGEESAVQPDGITTSAEVSFENVQIKDDFWTGRQDQSLEVGIEACANNLKTSIQNFEYAGLVAADGDLSDYKNYTFSSNFAADSDVYKLMEGMAYAITNYKDSTDDGHKAAVQKIRDYFEDWIPKIVSAQSADGYIDTLYTLKNYLNLTPDGRFKKKAWHELYCAGHLYEAAIAIYNATGDRRLLDVSVKNMELLYEAFYLKDTTHYTVGYDVDFHEEVELALIKLAATLYNMEDYGKDYAEKCITLSQFYLDRNMKIANNAVKNSPRYKPVSELTEAWGHCVRAFYLYTAMTDMCIYSGDALYSNLETLWENVETKTYITGGMGHDDYTEGFADSYDLANNKSYCETCSSISNVFWNKSMHLKDGQTKYYDNIEKQLYNNILSGIGFDGWHFYYQNRLINEGGVSRPTWYGTPCCPTNLMRLIQKLGSYIYTTKDNAVSVNLYIGNDATVNLNGTEIGMKMTSTMPWEGNAELALSLDEAKNFTLRLRMPKWATGRNTLLINGETYAVTPDSDGYVSVTRDWSNGDTVKLTMPMSAKIVDDSELITTNKGTVAVTRGPITYAVEAIDNGDAFNNACINKNTTFTTNMVYDFGTANDYGTQKLQMLIASTQTVSESLAGADGTATLNMIPFYAWANRGLTPMKVYVQDGLTDPYEGKDLAQAATVTASYTHMGDSASNINDGVINTAKRWSSWNSSYDEGVRNPVLTMTFPKYASLTGTDIYYYDDNGGCRVPDSIEIQYWNGTAWTDVSMASTPTPSTTDFTSYIFEEVTTDKLRIKLHHASRALGIVEWKVTGQWTDIAATVEPSSIEASYTWKGDDVANIIDGDVNKNKRWTSWAEPLDDAAHNPYITLTFPKYASFTSMDVYFFDDGSGCRLPENYTIQYLDGADWKDVTETSAPTLLTDDFTHFTFNTVSTTKLRLKLQHATKAVGIVELKVSGTPAESPEAKPSAIEASYTWKGDNAANIIDGVVQTGKRWTSYAEPLDEAAHKPYLILTYPKYAVFNAMDIYYYDDGGNCRLPEKVSLQYWTGTAWADVTMISAPAPQKDDFTHYTFESVYTKKLRLNLENNTYAVGIVEWAVTGEWVKNPAFVKTAAVTTDGTDVTALSGITESGYVAAPKAFNATVQNTVSVNGKNYELTFWTVDNRYTDAGTTLELPLVAGDQRTITAHYAPSEANDYTVTFINRNGTVIGSITKSEGFVTADDLTAAGIAADNIFGYNFIGWSCDFADMSSTMTVIPVYEKDETATLCHITVNGGSINGETALDARFDSKLTAVAEVPSGKVFSHWKDAAGQVLSHESTYSFYAASNLALTAVFKNDGEETPAVAEVILNMNPIWTVSGGKADIVYTVMVNVPAGATVLEQGILIGGNSYSSDPSALKLTACDQKGTAVIRDNAHFMITLKSVKSGRVRNVRAYAKYELGGNTYTVYSNAAVRATVSNTAVATEAINF